VIASIVGNQSHAQRIAVGDSAQAIYEWRGAINAMTKWPGTQLVLSKSFRFGPAIATEANRWLDVVNAPLRLSGHAPIPSRLAVLEHPQAILARSNAGAIRELLLALAANQRAALVGGGEAIRSLAGAAQSLKAGRGTEHPELFAFTSWGEVQEYVEQDEAGADLKTFVTLIDEFGPETIIDALDHLVDEPDPDRPGPAAADVTISTAHKAKGREWDTVRISDDFHEPRRTADGDHLPVKPGEARLAYVAVTRARRVLDRGSLAWIDGYSPIQGPFTDTEGRF
jgi:superfamily I DNA/RNA helicase